MENVKFTNASGTMLSMELDGQTIFVPADSSNRFYAAMVESGIVPEPFVAPTPPMPLITARQLRLQLISMGLSLSSIDVFIDNMPEQQRQQARVEWEYATSYDRSHPLVEVLAGALSLNDEEVDNAWRAAAQH